MPPDLHGRHFFDKSRTPHVVAVHVNITAGRRPIAPIGMKGSGSVKG
jgi:hypothetical protein